METQISRDNLNAKTSNYAKLILHTVKFVWCWQGVSIIYIFYLLSIGIKSWPLQPLSRTVKLLPAMVSFTHLLRARAQTEGPSAVPHPVVEVHLERNGPMGSLRGPYAHGVLPGALASVSVPPPWPSHMSRMHGGWPSRASPLTWCHEQRCDGTFLKMSALP